MQHFGNGNNIRLQYRIKEIYQKYNFYYILNQVYKVSFGENLCKASCRAQLGKLRYNQLETDVEPGLHKA